MKYLTFMIRFKKECIDSICIDVPFENEEDIPENIQEVVLRTLAEGVFDPDEQEFIKTFSLSDIASLFQLHKVMPGNDRTY